MIDITGQSPIIGVASADAPQGNFISYLPIKENDMSVELRSPEEPGQYEIRFYKDGSNLTEASISGLGKFIVEEEIL
jgi:hypothetical protein